jgi:diguanylate cyclase (GGDEF)-like protein
MTEPTLYRVMLVEDNPGDARLVREMLAEHTAFTFQVAHFLRLEPALGFLERDTVDVVLLDYRLPDVDELDGLTRIIAIAPNLPVVMLTGLDDEAIGLALVQHGAQDYLVKGTVDGAMLVRAIRQAIERKRMSDQVRDSEERFALAAAGSGDGLWDWEIPSDRLVLSRRAKLILGLPEDMPDEHMESFSRRVHLDDIGRFRDAMAAHLKGETPDFRQQARMMDPNDGPLWVLVRGLAVMDAKGQARRMAGSITDLANLDAYYDAATGLPNRALLIDRLRSILKRRLSHADYRSALLLVVFSRYALICETHGRAAGDALMTGAARAIEASARQGDMVARVSTHEIAVLLDSVAGADEAIVTAGRVCRALLAPIIIDGHDVVPAMRMGAVVMSATYTDPETVMRDAVAALAAEPAGSDLQFCVFNPEMRTRARERLRIEAALQYALERNAFQLAYQPIVALDGGALRGFEALLRWRDAELGPISPAAFIPIAEEMGLIQEIGGWVLRTACHQIAKWRADGLISDENKINVSVSVNLSGRQLDGEYAADSILAVIAETGVRPSDLTLELTETALSGNPDHARDALMAIKLHGVSLAMDDFGTGYSSLSYLGRFPFDKLKIDQSFVRTIAAGTASPLLKGMIGLTKELGLQVVAEGVETAEQRDVLAALGCQNAQGWLFGRPVDADGAEALLQSAARAWRALNAAATIEEATEVGIDGIERRLAAILVADVVGSSHMTVHEQANTTIVSKDVHGVVDPMIIAYRGRIVATPRHGYMLEFTSVVDAVSCAMAVQRAIVERSAHQPEDRRMEFRIGIALGDVIVRGADISGDGIDIAKGLAALAIPGGICISGNIYDHVSWKHGLRFEDIGPQQVADVARAIPAYRVEMASPELLPALV